MRLAAFAAMLAVAHGTAGPAAAYNMNGRDPTDGSTGGVNGGDAYGINQPSVQLLSGPQLRAATSGSIRGGPCGCSAVGSGDGQGGRAGF